MDNSEFMQGMTNTLIRIAKESIVAHTSVVEQAINMTPTSEKRNLVTEANLLLHEARRKLTLALEM